MAGYRAVAVTKLTTEMTGPLQIPASSFWPRLLDVSWQPHSQLSHMTQIFHQLLFYRVSKNLRKFWDTT